MKLEISTDKPFTLDELKTLLQTVRDIERRDPVREVKVWMDAPELKIEEVREILREIKPGFRFWSDNV